MRTFSWVAVLISGLVAGQAPGEGARLVDSGGVAYGAQDGASVSDADQARAEAMLASYYESASALAARGLGDPLPFQAYPQSGNVYRDIHHFNYVDIAPEPEFAVTFDCVDHTFEGSTGHDTMLRSFDEQDIGVPVYAVADGVVAALYEDGEDRNERNEIGDANFVIIDHGQGLTTRYWHLKRDSVVVEVGQAVESGQQIALTGSSGIQTPEGTPRLHFETRLDGEPIEPMTGACNTGESLWESQWANDLKPKIVDQGFVRGDMGFQWSGHPFPYPRSNHVFSGDTRISYWVQGLNSFSGMPYRFRFISPSGETAFESEVDGTTLLPGARWYVFYWVWDVPAMRQEMGEWTVQIDYFDTVEVEYKVRVFTLLQDFVSVDRAPAAVTATLEPATPDPDKPVWARIYPDLANDDPDYDLVRYTYTWRVNSEVTRTLTSAGHADALPASHFGPGDVVTCEVTSDDGVNAPCPIDITGDRVVDGVDLAVLLAAWNGEDGDLTGDGVTDSADLALLLSLWGACP